MHGDVERVLISHEQIAARVRELAQEITADHAEGAEITIVLVMTGAFVFCGDLIRQIPIAMRIGLITVSSYPGATMRTRGSQVMASQLGDLRGRHVLIVDDILDSGGTLRLVTPMLDDRGAASVKSCVLLRKDRPEARATPVDYVGFEIPDEFVVGYGLDFNDYYRNLPDIVTLKPSVVNPCGADAAKSTGSARSTNVAGKRESRTVDTGRRDPEEPEDSRQPEAAQPTDAAQSDAKPPPWESTGSSAGADSTARRRPPGASHSADAAFRESGRAL